MTAYSKQLIIFDLDGTLCSSKFPVSPDIAALITQLLRIKKVAIMSGGGMPEIQKQLLSTLPNTSENLSNLLLLPTSGTKLYAWKGAWHEEYSEHLTLDEKEKIKAAVSAARTLAGYQEPQKIYGELMDDRDSQMTFSALGQNAPFELKAAWDPNREKRQKIISFLQKRIPEFDARIGGSTSIDITKKGVNKAYGIRKLEEYLKMPLDYMLFIGDTLYHGGNDYPAKATGIDCMQISGPEDTKKIIESWVV